MRSPVTKYLVLGGSAVVATVLLAFFSGSSARRDALLLAVAVAVPVQAVAFTILYRVWDRGMGFMVAWLGGSLLRLAALGLLGLIVVLQNRAEPAWSLLGLVGLFFVLHLFEPLVLHRGGGKLATSDRHE